MPSVIQEVMMIANRELETMELDDLRSFYFDRRVNELLAERGVSDV